MGPPRSAPRRSCEYSRLRGTGATESRLGCTEPSVFQMTNVLDRSLRCRGGAHCRRRSDDRLRISLPKDSVRASKPWTQPEALPPSLFLSPWADQQDRALQGKASRSEPACAYGQGCGEGGYRDLNCLPRSRLPVRKEGRPSFPLSQPLAPKRSVQKAQNSPEPSTSSHSDPNS